jgi:hypothetical protein
MSSLTECNYCTLKGMEERAKGRGVTVIVSPGEGSMGGWKSARYSDQELPSAHFLTLTDHCVC